MQTELLRKLFLSVRQEDPVQATVLGGDELAFFDIFTYFSLENIDFFVESCYNKYIRIVRNSNLKY